MEESIKEKESTDGGDKTPTPVTESVDNSEEKKESLNNVDNHVVIKSRNVATRGKKRKFGGGGAAVVRVTPKRNAARSIKTYMDEENVDSDRAGGPDDPDYQFSDSDDDPDFAPSKKSRHGSSSPDRDFKPRRGGKGRGRWRGCGRPRSIEKPTFTTTVDETPSPAAIEEVVEDTTDDGDNKKRGGRPPSYFNQDSTISSTEDANSSAAKLSSAYNYSALRSRQNQAVRLPEGPNLTQEQLKLIESQFKSGDFVMAKKDTDMMENPPIWRIDGKSLLQKFQAFEKDGKTLYRNISTYSGWTAQAKALYVPVKVNFVFQSRYDIVVELTGFKGGDQSEPTTEVIDKPVWMPKNKDFEIPEQLKVHKPSFEIYTQTLISQALDNNFLQEIYDENDSYFVDRVKVIDDLCDDRKKQILQFAKWKDTFQTTLNTWPCVNTMVSKMSGNCQACNENPAAMLSQFYGQPYDKTTLRSKEPPSATEIDNKNFETCNSCSTLSQLYNKVDHQKYDFYSQCKSTVTNMRVSDPNKTTTNVLRDLLANDEWITGLFRSMCTAFVKIDKLNNDEVGCIQEETKDEENDKDVNPDEENDKDVNPDEETEKDIKPDDETDKDIKPDDETDKDEETDKDVKPDEDTQS